MRPRRPSIGQMEKACEAFNSLYRPGDRLRVYPAEIGGRVAEVTLLKPGAYVLGGHSAVARVDGGFGCIALGHVLGRVRPPEEPAG